jgi:tyrosyl-tRNA synthetase
MGKSEGNAVFLNEDPKDIYGKVMSWPDGLIGPAFELCTQVPRSEIALIVSGLKDQTANPRDLKMKLAWELTRIVGSRAGSGEDIANLAQEHFINTIQKKEVPDDLPSYSANGQKKLLVDWLVDAKLAASKTEARQKITEGAIKLKFEDSSDDSTAMQVIKDVKYELDFSPTVKSVVIQKGKFNFVRICAE